jgi:DNA-binding LacI/PurR family transcriptional regulator
MNIKEVAKRARVSTATVSRTLNFPDRVRPRTAERVRKAIAELNFYPNSHARSLVSGRSRMLGLIISDITNPFFPELVKSFEDNAVKSGLEVIIGNTGYSPERMVECLRRMVERKVEGVAVMTSETMPEMLVELGRRHIPTVLLDTGMTGHLSSNIRVDYAQGIREAVQHLLRLHHRRIAFIAGPSHLPSAVTRQSAFVHELKENGIPVGNEMLASGDHRVDGGTSAMKSLLRLHPPPSAVIASNDLMAIGALCAARDAGLSVPGDISIVGFDDIAFARMTEPPLTTVSLSRETVASTAVSALEHMASQRASHGREYVVSTRLVVRKSTGRFSGGAA